LDKVSHNKGARLCPQDQPQRIQLPNNFHASAAGAPDTLALKKHDRIGASLLSTTLL
jgi:hypothetical protein